LFGRFVRQGQEAARAARKTVRFETRGEAVELDTSIIEQIVDPLLHLVQNTIAHGIETPEERHACGKDATGTVTLSAAHEGGAVPLNAAQLVTEVRPDDVRPGPRGEAIVVGDDLVDLVPLSSILGLERLPQRARRPVIVVRGAGRTLAVEVAEILHKQEIVVKP